MIVGEKLSPDRGFHFKRNRLLCQKETETLIESTVVSYQPQVP